MCETKPVDDAAATQELRTVRYDVLELVASNVRGAGARTAFMKNVMLKA